MSWSATKIIDAILEREGLYVDHPDDRGGPTKYGITIETLRRFRGDRALTSADLRALTEQEARAIYEAGYVKPFYWVEDPALAELLIDSAVQHSVSRAVRLLQEAAGETTDGVIGPRTRHAVSMAVPADLWRRVLGVRMKFYAQLIRAEPAQRVFAAGWLARLAGLCG